MLFRKIFGDFCFGGRLGGLVAEENVEFCAGTVGISRLHTALPFDLNTLNLPLLELGELPADEVGDFGVSEGSDEGAFGGVQNLAVFGDVIELSEFIDDGGKDLLLVFAAVEIAVFEGFALAGVTECAVPI